MRVRPTLVLLIASLCTGAAFAEDDLPEIDATVEETSPTCTGDPLRFVSQHGYTHEGDWQVFTLRNMAPGPGCRIKVWFDVYRRDAKHAQGTVLLEVPKTNTVWVDRKTSFPKVWVRYARFE